MSRTVSPRLGRPAPAFARDVIDLGQPAQRCRGQLPIERAVVILAAIADIQPINFWCKEFRDLVAGSEVGQDGQR